MECSNCVFEGKQWACTRCTKKCCFADKNKVTFEELKDLQNKACDVEYLKTQLKDLDRPVFNSSDHRNMKDLVFYDSYYKDLKYISSLYKVKLKIRKPYKNGDDSSFYRHRSRRIFLVTTKSGIFSNWDVYVIFTHELSHAIQHSLLCKYIEQYPITKLSQAVLYERTAERLAYFVYKKYFDVDNRNIVVPQNFSCYTSKKDQLYLYKHFHKSKFPLDDDLGVTQ